MAGACLFCCICGLLILFSPPVMTEHKNLKLRQNRYTGLLIAIHKNVSEDQTILSNLQEYYESMSLALHVATRKRASLGAVTILVPSTWATNSSYEPATTEFYENSQIRIAPKIDTWGDIPFTIVKSANCKGSGEYTHLTPHYVLDRNFADIHVGSIDKTLVHEFGHLRWGLRNEYPDVTKNHSSPCSNLKAVCSQTLAVKKYGEGSQCNLIPDATAESSNASLMFMPFHPQVTEFCDDDNHNADVENDQNDKCDGQSNWYILRQHEDFKDDANQPNSTYIKPSFRIVKVMPIRNIIAIDVSGSIDDGKVDAIQTQLRNYIMTSAPNNSFLGLVQFSYSFKTEVTHPLTHIVSDADRKAIVDKLPSSNKGSTCIKCGIEIAVQELKRVGSAAGAIVTVFSDGKENIYTVQDLIPDLIKDKVVVDSVLFGPDHEDHLVSVSSATGGSVRVVESSEDLHLALSDLMKIRAEDARDVPIQAFSEGGTVQAGKKVERFVEVDSSISERTIFTFSWHQANAMVKVTLYTPAGKAIGSGSPDYELRHKSVVISLNKAQVGRWKYIFQNNEPSDTITFRLSIQGNNPVSNEPVLIQSSLQSETVNISSGQMEMMIYATLTRGGYPVINCRVQAEIKTSSATHSLVLLDNGAQPDNRKEDGVYSGYFLHFTSDGYYSVVVNSTIDSAKCKTKIVSQSFGEGTSVKRLYDLKRTERYEPVEAGSRVASAGFFTVTGSTGFDVQSLPPAKISDLRITDTNEIYGTSTLTWTAAGSNLNEGTAAFYEVRYSNNTSKIRGSFMEASMIHKGTSPLQAGNQEVVVIRIPTSGHWGVAVVTVDKEGNRGDVSNVVYVRVKAPSIVSTVSTEQWTESTRVTREISTQTMTDSMDSLTVGLSVGVTVVFLILAVMIAYVIFKKVKVKAKVQNGDVSGSRIEFVNVGDDSYLEGHTTPAFDNPSYDKTSEPPYEVISCPPVYEQIP